MTRRERLTRCYFHQQLDRPAVYSRSGFPQNDPSYAPLKAFLAAHSELKSTWHGAQCETPLPFETKREAYSEDFDRRVDHLHTPRGDLKKTAFESRHGLPGLHETYLVNDSEEAETFLSLPLPSVGGDVTSFFRADADMGEKGIVEVRIGTNPAGFAAGLCGSENFALMSCTDREVLHRLCERQMVILRHRVSFLLNAGVGPFFSMLGEEYLVPPLHGPHDFNDFNVRYDKPIIDLVHDAGGRVHIHSHGPIKSVFQGFLDMGSDVLHPFESPPQGDLLAREAKALARGKMCLEGNIQIHRMYEADPEDIRRETEQLIRDTFDDHQGLIVCPTASPFIFGRGAECFPRYRAMIDTVRSYT